MGPDRDHCRDVSGGDASDKRRLGGAVKRVIDREMLKTTLQISRYLGFTISIPGSIVANRGDLSLLRW